MTTAVREQPHRLLGEFVTVILSQCYVAVQNLTSV